jgi:mRNA interferase MazF
MIRQPQRGEIWSVNFAPAIGSEIKKVCPAVIINIPEAGRLPLSIVIPITDWKTQFEQFFWFVNIVPSKENGLSKESGADCFQIKSISKNRFLSKIGIIENDQLYEIIASVSLCIGYNTSLA